MQANGSIAFGGSLRTKVITKEQKERAKKRQIFWWHVKNWLTVRWREIPLYLSLALAKGLQYFIPSLVIMYTSLRVKVIKANGEVWDYGLVGRNTITTVGKGFVVDAWQNSVELENMKYHGIGTNNTAPTSGDTALNTEITTQYNPDNTRATGTTTEASATVFRTVGVNTVDASAAIVEWGLLSQAATGGGVLFDRQTFSTINLANGDSLSTTYDLTVS